MKKFSLILTLLIAFCVPWAHAADPVTMTTVVADGTGANQYIPVYGFYCDETQVVQMIYPASELGDLTNGDVITALKFYVSGGSNAGDWNISTFKVRLANTTMANLSSSYDQTPSTEVYSGFLTANTTDGMTVTFSTPFTYTGGNLLIQFSQPSGSSYADVYFYGKNVTGAGRYKTNSTDITSGGTSQDFLPKCQITYQTIPPSCFPLQSLNASDITRTSLTANWAKKDVATNCVGYEVKISTSSNSNDAGISTAIIDNPATTSYVFSNLERNTTYYLHARPNCGEEDGYGEWISTSAKTQSLSECLNITVADGTATNNRIPVYGGYCDENQKTQSIYPASMLTELVGKQISKLKYEVTSGGSSSWSSAVFEIRMMTVEASTLSGILPTTGATLVYTGTLSASTNNGMEINLSTPFTYTGGNLLIEFNEIQTSDYGDCYFKGTEVSSASYLANVGYGVGVYDFLPKVDFGYCETVEACPAVTNVAVSDIAQTTANLSWTASTGDYANTYDVLVRTSPVGSFAHIVPTYVNLDSCGKTLTDLEPYTDYYVYVRVKCDAREHTDGEAWSEAVQFKTLSNCITPTDFTVTPLTKTSAKAQWTATSQTSNYRYILSTEELEDPDVEAVTASGITGNNVLLNRLTPGETYYLYLSNACGGTDGNSPYIFTTFTMPEACLAPTEMNISDVQKYQMTLNWTPSQYADATDAYDIIVSDTVVTDFTGVEPTYEAVTGTSKVIDLLQRNTTYYIYMRSNCGEGAVTDWSAAVSETTDPLPSGVDEKQIGTGTVTSSYSYPFSAYYHNSYTQQVYSKSEINHEPGSISNISFNYFWVTATTRFVTVYMANVAEGASLFSGWVSSGLTEVYSGKATTFSSTDGWCTLPLDNAFEYTGGDIVVAVYMQYNSCETQYNGAYRFYYSNGGSARCATNDNMSATGISLNGNHVPSSTSGSSNSYRPNIRFAFPFAIEACPAVDAPVATDITNNSATISWNAGTGDFATSYDLIVSDTVVTDFTGAALAADDVTETSFDVTGLAANTHYYTYVRVNCVNEIYDDGLSLWSPAGEFTTELACLKPENFVAGSPLSDRVELSWIKKGTAVDWKIYVDTFDVEYTAWLSADTVLVNAADCQIVEDTVTYLLTGLQPEKAYTLALLADCGETDSLSKFATNIPSFITLSNNTKIDTMTITSAEVFSTVINREAKTIDFVVRKGSNLEAMYGNITLNHYGAQVRVNSEDFTQPWDLSAPVTVTVLAQDTNVTADWTITVTEETCATPFNVAATDVERRTANLVWNIGDASTQFDVIVSETELSESELADTTVQSVTVTNTEGACTYAITGLTRETHYYVYLRTNCGETFGQWRGTDFTTKSLLVCDEETIADGTNTSAYFPFYGYYQDTQGTESQFIYGSDMLTELRGKSISKMTFYSSTPSQSFTGTNRVSIGITSDDSFSGAFKTSPSQIVFTGQVSVSGGLHTIVFDAPFEYPAEGGNLLIEYYLTAAGNYQTVNFYGINTSNYAGRCRTSNYNFLPKVTFEACASSNACPEVTNVAVTGIEETSATVTWTESTGDYANTSDIYYSETPVTDFTDVAPQVTGATGNSAQITGLSQYTTYYVYVRTHCNGEGQDDGVSPWAGGTSFRTLSPCRVPGTPEATITGKHTATVAWTNTSEGSQADNFTYIYSATPIAEADLETASATASAYNDTTVDLTGLLSETTYYFYVRNVCAGDVNCSSPWDSCQFTMPVAMPAVINLQTYDIASNAFSAVWESDLANFADETAWEIACVPAGETPASWTEVSAPEYFAIGLTPSTNYDFYVRAVDGENYSANAKADVTTTAVPEDCQEFVAGTTTVTNAPMYTNYGGSYSVLIYTAEELTAQGYVAGDIEKISFYQTSCGNTTTASMYQKTTTLWMGNTTKSSFSSSSDWLSGLTQVMNPTPVNFNKVNDWVDMNLDQAFTWDGTSNIAVAVLAYSSSYTTMAFRGGSSSSGSVSIFSYMDATNWTVTDGTPSITINTSVSSSRPNIKFCFAPEACRSVTNLVVDNITTTSARAHWYPGATETEWQVINSTEQLDAFDAFDALATGYATVTDPQITYTDLIKDMDYYFYVRGICGEGDTSKWKEIHYTTLPSCSAPATAVASSEADNSITFTVTFGKYGTEGTYDYRYWIVGTTDTTTVSAQGAEYTATGIAGCVDYAWEVRANCSGEDEGASRWVAGNDVHVCGAVTLPYSESFETIPTSYSGPGMIETICWNDLNAGATSSSYPYYKASTSYATDGSKTLQFYSSSVTPIYMILPEIADATQCQVKFDCSYENLISGGKFQVGYLTDPTDATTFVPSFTDNPTATYSMQTRTVNIFNIPEGARIAICYTAGSSSNYYGWLDNVRVDTIPYYNVATAVAPELTPAIGSIEVAYNEDDTLSEGVFYGGSAPVFTAVPNEGIKFTNWTNANTGDTLSIDNPWTITVAQDTAIVANFDTASFDLNVVVAPGHDIFGEVAGSGTFLYGRTVNFSASPMDHYSVVWPDGNTDNNHSMVMPGHDTTIVAHFTIDKHQLTVAMNDSSKGTVTGTGVYDYGTFVEITATPNDPDHIIFTGWSNGETNDTITIDLQHDSTVVANFIWDEHTVTTSVNDESMGSVTGAGTYTHDDVARLIATPADHHIFVEWSNGLTNDTIDITVVSDTALTATFDWDSHDITVLKNVDSMGVVTGAGNYYHGTPVTLTATPAAHHHFVDWSTGETTTTIMVTADDDKTITANFAADIHTIAANVNDTVMGHVEGAGEYAYGTMATLTAVANEHYHFVNWSNGETSDVLSFVVVGDSTITANFAIDQHIVTVNANDDALGTVTGAGTYNYGSQVTLTATPADAHSLFIGWSNGETNDTIVITVTGDTTITANFTPDSHIITANVNDTVMGHVEGAGEYVHGSMATLTAVANEHYHFVNWSNGETSDVLSFVVVGDSTVTANFAIDQHNITAQINGNGSVTGEGTYNYGDQATLTATADAGYEFDGWEIDGVSYTDSTVIITVEKDMIVVANFIVKTSVEETETDNYVAYVENNEIIVSGVAEHTVSVYDMNGRLVSTIKNAADVERFTVNAAGVYVIRVNNMASTRVIVK